MKLNSAISAGASIVFLYGSLVFSQSNVSAEKTCAKLSGETVARVCTGDLVESRRKSEDLKAVVNGLVTGIEAGVAEDGHAIGILTVQTKAGIAHLTTRGFVIVTPGTCLQDAKRRDQVWLGETFKNERDGRTLQVRGFAVNDGLGLGSAGVVVRDLNEKQDFERLLDSGTIFDSHTVAKTGKMTRYGSCDSEIPFLDNLAFGSLPGCAMKSAAEQLKESCRNYCGSTGKINKRDVEPAKPECVVQPNMIPPSKKVCTIILTAKCTCD